jgi:hypothetical protein
MEILQVVVGPSPTGLLTQNLPKSTTFAATVNLGEVGEEQL